jgi:predicted AAA+ superfamily ATPase
MPGLIGRDNEAVPNYFLSYMQTYIERDIRTMSNIENFQDFNFFVRLLSALTAQKINAAQLGREIGISNNTATKWKNLLLGTYLWLELPPYSKNLIKRVSKKPKGYMLDTGLACYLQRLSSPNALAEHPNRGAMFETYCVNQIYGYLQSKLHQPMLYHWRSANQAEVDVVLEQDGWLFPIEIKCKTTIDPYDLRGIKAFKDAYPQEKIYMGVVLYAGDVVRLLTKDIVAIPWNFLPQN